MSESVCERVCWRRCSCRGGRVSDGGDSIDGMCCEMSPWRSMVFNEAGGWSGPHANMKLSSPPSLALLIPLYSLREPEGPSGEGQGLLPVKRFLWLAKHTRTQSGTFVAFEIMNHLIFFFFVFSFCVIVSSVLSGRKWKYRRQLGRIIRTSLWFQSAEQKIQWTKEKEK